MWSLGFVLGVGGGVCTDGEDGGSATPAKPATFEGIDLSDPVLAAIEKAAQAAKEAALAAGVKPAPELHSTC
jgi:hypothetical protein